MVDDIRLIEVLRRHGARASFNLNLGRQPARRTLGWRYGDRKEVHLLARGELRDVYEGFLVANHGYTHPDLTRVSGRVAEQAIRQGRDALEQHFGYAVTGFAYPFGAHNAAVREQVRAAGHRYARTIESTPRVFPPGDPMAFHPACHFRAIDFWSRFERARLEGDVFYFWGHSYELVTEEDWQAFERTMTRLGAAPDVEWTWLPDLFPAHPS